MIVKGAEMYKCFSEEPTLLQMKGGNVPETLDDIYSQGCYI